MIRLSPAALAEFRDLMHESSAFYNGTIEEIMQWDRQLAEAINAGEIDPRPSWEITVASRLAIQGFLNPDFTGPTLPRYPEQPEESVRTTESIWVSQDVRWLIIRALLAARREPAVHSDFVGHLNLLDAELDRAGDYICTLRRGAGAKRRAPETPPPFPPPPPPPRPGNTDLLTAVTSVQAVARAMRSLGLSLRMGDHTATRLFNGAVKRDAAFAIRALETAISTLRQEQDYGHDGLWPRRPGHARLRHSGDFPEVPEARDHALALIRRGTAPTDAVSQCAAEHRVEPVALGLAVGGALNASQLKSHEKDDKK